MKISTRQARQIRAGILLAKEYEASSRENIELGMSVKQRDEHSKRYVQLATRILSSNGIEAYRHTIEKSIEKSVANVLRGYVN